MSATSRNNGKGNLVPIDELANHPILVSLNWDARALAYLRRMDLIEGVQDGTTKMWYVYLEDVLEVLEARNNNKLRGIIDIDEADWGL